MGDLRQRTRLLIFTLGARRERRRRRLLPRSLAGWESALHRRCLDSALAAGREVGLEVVVSAPREAALPRGTRAIPQGGAGFAERFAGSVEAVEDRPVIAVGTDVPGLGAEHLDATLAHLARDPETVVVGPSPDGGCYLVAAARPIAGMLASVRWCRRSTLRSLLAAIAATGRPVALLPPLADLDRRSDLERWLSGRRAIGRPFARLAARLVEMLAALRRPLETPAFAAAAVLAPVRPPGRAPPAVRRAAL